MLEPEKIKGKKFTTVKNGCSPSEVSEFLSQIADEVSALIAQNEDNEAKLVTLVEKINEYRDDEEAIKSAMILAQKESNKILNDAKAKARDMIDSAKSEQTRLIEQNSAEIERIKAEHKANCEAVVEEQTEAVKQEILAVHAQYEAEKAALDDLRAQATYFKADLAAIYSEQLQTIMKMPQMSGEELDDYENGYDDYDEEYDDYDDYDEPTQDEIDENRFSFEKTAEQKHIDEVLNTASFEPIIPKQDAGELQFGKNSK